jgi:hypothetical protein
MGEHHQLSQLLEKMHQPFLLTYNDVPEIWSLYHWAKIEPLLTTYTLHRPKQTSELMITNF